MYSITNKGGREKEMFGLGYIAHYESIIHGVETM
jgi:hypothetical protein